MTQDLDADRADGHLPVGADGHMQISEVAERVNLSHRTVRYYDDEGLLVAARSAGNYRLYTEADVQRLLMIRVMKPLGFSLDDMRQLIATLTSIEAGDSDDPAALLQNLSEFITTSQRYRVKMANNLAAADVWIADLQKLARRIDDGPAAMSREDEAHTSLG